MIERTLLWTPHAKQRPRTAFKQGQYRTFTPRETVQAERALAQQWVGPPMEGWIAVSLDLWDDHIDIGLDEMPGPTSRKMNRGDLDNYVKLVLDGLNGHAWADDRQIRQIRAAVK